MNNLLFWNVDTQYDFISPNGKLYVQGAESILPVLKKITKLASDNNIKVVNTADYHYPDSKELSDSPDFINTFPQHCMADTSGADYVEETNPIYASELKWNVNYSNAELKKIASNRNIIIRKDAFDVFEGNPNTDTLLSVLNPKTVVVYGVTTNVCVDKAVMGLAQRGVRVIVIDDAIKELPNIPLPFDDWEKLGVKRINFSQLEI